MLDDKDKEALEQAMGGGTDVDNDNENTELPNSTPATTDTTQSQQNGDETAVLKAKIELLSKDLAELEGKIEADFIRELPNLLDEQTKELRFADDPAPYIQAVDEAKKKFIASKKDALQGELDKLTDEYGSKKESAAIDKVWADFLAKHPDVNKQELIEFYNNDMTPRQAEQARAATDIPSMMEAIYEAFKASKPEAQKPATKKQPPNLTQENTAPVSDPTIQDKNDAFDKAVGFK